MTPEEAKAQFDFIKTLAEAVATLTARVTILEHVVSQMVEAKTL